MEVRSAPPSLTLPALAETNRSLPRASPSSIGAPCVHSPPAGGRRSMLAKRLFWLLPAAVIACSAGCLLRNYNAIPPVCPGSMPERMAMTQLSADTAPAMPPGPEQKDSSESYAAINENAFRRVDQH